MNDFSIENIETPERSTLHAYVINLQDASQRRENMHADLAILGIEYTRIEAIHGDDLTEPIEGYDEHQYQVLTGKVTNKRAVGCYLSHIKALREFLTSNRDYALILEDDAILPKDILPLLNAVLAHDAHWDMVRLTAEKKGTYLPFANLPGGHELAYNTRVLKNTAAYLVNRHAAQCCVEKMLPMRLPYDVALDRDWDFGFRTACVIPFPVKLKADEPSQIPRAERIRLYRSSTFHLFHYLTYIERRIHRTRYFREAQKRKSR
ncbi:MAG: glycosyltransferase family 25 protein [Verrucomicrobia bacterium]|nr:glycosyltransferase family 25 protein [Verrucomicrobiota bacterium]